MYPTYVCAGSKEGDFLKNLLEGKEMVVQRKPLNVITDNVINRFM
jgi:hypothetical protein